MRQCDDRIGGQSLLSTLSVDAKSLHDFADEDVELAIGLLAHFRDFVGARFVARDRGAAGWRRVARRKIDNDAQVLAASSKFQNGIGQASLRTQDGAVWFCEVHDELTLQINAFPSHSAIGEITLLLEEKKIVRETKQKKETVR